MSDESWKSAAPCRGLTDLFFPVDHFPWAYDPARLICSACPVFDSCLASVEARPEEHGMFAGMTPAERRDRRVRLARKNAAAREARASVSIQLALQPV